ncbi:MAG: ribonuclease E/G [Hyphomonadaceae bacterium]
MSVPLDVWLDGAIGETRYAIARAGRPIALVITRWSDHGRRARWGEIYVGRVRKVERALGGAFVDLGLRGEQGFLPRDAGGQIEGREAREGEAVCVRIAREGARGKGPVLAGLGAAPAGAEIGRTGRREEDAAHDDAAPADAATRAALDAAIEEALAVDAPLPGGGFLRIETTAALTAIDVDAAGRKDAGDREGFARALNIEAAAEAMRHLRLRAQGGLAAIDFVSMRRPENRKAVESALREAARGDPWGPVFAPMSRFGVVELTRAQYMLPVRETLLDSAGRKSAETVALEGLRALEREAAHAHGRKLIARAPQGALDWLESDAIAWRAPLSARIGARWEIVAGPPGARVDVQVT